MIISVSMWLLVLVFVLMVLALFLKISSDGRRLHTDYRSYFSLNEDEHDGSISITNHGPGHMINCFLRLTIDDVDNSTSIEYDIHIPIIALYQSSVVSLPKGSVGDENTLRKLQMEFQTQSEERLKYYQTVTRENEVLTVKHTLYRVGNLSSRQVYEYNTVKSTKSPSQ